MALVTAHLLSLKQDSEPANFRNALKEIRRRPDGKASLLWAAQCHHWIHEPRLSQAALAGDGSTLTKWDYVVAFASATATLPSVLENLSYEHWSISFDAAEPLIDTDGTKLKDLHAGADSPSLPMGWAPSDLSGLAAGAAPSDLVLSLDTKSPRFGQDKISSLTPLREFTRTFTESNPGPIVMFNLLSFMPDQMPQYLKYVGGFLANMSPRYGPKPLIHGFGTISDWSSRGQEEKEKQEGGWEGVGIVWYPSLLHFAKMLDDEEYAELDRKYKFGVLRDNPLIVCTSIGWDEL